MNKCTVLILGANGFVGGNIVSVFQQKANITTFSTSRKPKVNQIYFDLLDQSSWKHIVGVKPDFIIDATGYGVVKEQTDLDLLYKINYILKTSFFDYISQYLPESFWIQIGTAFEYSLEQEQLTEESLCLPKTHYGISKALFSMYLTQKIKKKFCIIKPFGMFGEAEAASKFFPMLILAQKEKRAIDLSDGLQQRDYFYINDLSEFLYTLIEGQKLSNLEGQTINVGSGKAFSLKNFSDILASQIPNFDPTYWNWGVVPKRQGENNLFYNASLKASDFGFVTTSLEKAFQKTVAYYYQYGTNSITI